MGSRDFGKREAKKPKKDTKKGPIIASVAKPQPMPVEVFKKAKKAKEQESE
jgi:hypothetical protein